MTISIIIPTLNEAKNIGQLITFLKCHADHRLLDIIVVDAQSADDTEGVACAHGAVVLQSPKRSRAIQMNLGARLAKGDVLYFIHADCTPPATFLDDIEEVFTVEERNPDSVGKGAPLGCFRYKFDKPSFLLRINSYFTRFSPLWCRGGDETLFVPKSIFEQLNGYDEQFCIMEEYDFIRRATAILPFKIIPKYAIVSARKYAQNGWLRVQLANLTAFSLFRFGVSSEKIARTYRQMLA